MQLISTLKSIFHGEIDRNQSLFCFYGSIYPGLFFSQFFAYVKKNGLSITTMHLESIETSHFLATTQMSFLGQKSFFWFPGLIDCPASKKKELSNYLAHYAGPHTLLFWSDQALGKTAIEVPAKVDLALFKELWNLLYPEIQFPKAMSAFFFQKTANIDWDMACMLMYYIQIGGQELDQNFIAKIIIAEKSLFTLSQYFFAKNQDLFLAAWRAVETDFPTEFWVVFWSEQLWQASLFVTQAMEVGSQAARKGINRLPFSFMQKDWKKYTVRELCAAHNFLYGIDYGIKNGYATHGLELFLFKFMQADFAKK